MLYNAVMKYYTLITAFFLTACGGGGDGGLTLLPPAKAAPPTMPNVIQVPNPRYDHLIVAQANDRIENRETWFKGSFMQPTETNAAVSVAIQSQQQYDELILSVGDVRNKGYQQGDVYLREVKNYPKFKYIYLYDELFWTGTGNQIGKDEEALNIAAGMVHAIGLKTAITIAPVTIMDPAFRMVNINAMDVIAIDMYPSLHLSTPIGACQYNHNPLTNLLYCSVKKLRDHGYNNEIWYVYQGFGLRSQNKAQAIEQLQWQRETASDAPNFGVTGLIAFGLHLSHQQLANEPDLYQGTGSDIESLVRP